jgi:hypothetical protein
MVDLAVRSTKHCRYPCSNSLLKMVDSLTLRLTVIQGDHFSAVSSPACTPMPHRPFSGSACTSRDLRSAWRGADSLQYLDAMEHRLLAGAGKSTGTQTREPESHRSPLSHTLHTSASPTLDAAGTRNAAVAASIKPRSILLRTYPR